MFFFFSGKLCHPGFWRDVKIKYGANIRPEGGTAVRPSWWAVLLVWVGGAHFVSMGRLLEFSPPRGAADQTVHRAFIPSCNLGLNLLLEL